MDNQATRNSLKGIAVIGMAGRFPGANNIDQFWQNLCNGVESIAFFTDEELVASGTESALLSDPNYVKAGAVLENIEMFDAGFFGFPPREAEVMDPQHRLFLECAWEALENAGYDPEADKGVTGVYAGGNLSSYLLNNLIVNRDLIKSLGVELTTISNDKDYIPTRVSYKLNLHGPSLNISTACSTSLVAVHLGCRGLLSYECDLALAGGITIQVPQAGYFYQQGGITSPDGHCRAFDAKAKGTTFGNGVGIVVLKRLEDALADGDCIHAVIKGSAVNNDGSLKVGYTAPSVDGQAEVIAESQALAGFSPETISYIETHGTGTALGDPIEIRALETVFRASTQKQGFCGIGSVKTNVGHLNSAAGVTSLIKTVLALKHKQIPPSLHFEIPNPQIDFANSPFYVNTELREWKTNGTPRRAGVSSFGIGGTNAHVVLEEAPTVEPSGKSRPWQVLLISAKTSSALDKATLNLAEHLEQHRDFNLADVAYTLSLGRRTFKHRRLLVCQDTDQARHALSTLEPKRVLTRTPAPGGRSVVFMFSGQGAQYVTMAQELYQSEPTFQHQIDICCELLKPHLGLDLRLVLYPNQEQLAEASEQLQQTVITQPALFVIEYALAQLWMEWGVRPIAMIGHSIGEYVAATLAGVLSLADALALVAARGKLIQELPSGSMLAVPLPATEVQPLLGKTLSLAAINGPSSCVVSGVTEAVEALEKDPALQGVACRRLRTSHACHSQMMEPILATFTQRVQQVSLNPPQIPIISTVTGTWITAEAMTPSYWAAHLRQTVRFEAGLQELLKEPSQILLEIGPGRTLTTLAKQHPDLKSEQMVLASIRHPQEAGSDVEFLSKALGQLWLAGVEVNWSGFYCHERRHHLPLPTYPFERQRYWIEPAQPGENSHVTSAPGKKPDIADWFYIPLWKQSVPPVLLKQEELSSQKTCTLVFIDECGLGSNLVNRLEQAGRDVISVKVGAEFTQLSQSLYTLNPGRSTDYDALIQELLAQQKLPERIVHLWSVTPTQAAELAGVGPQDTGFYSLLFLAQALGKNLSQALQITVVSSNMHSVTGEEMSPEKATLLGPVKVIPQEYPNIDCRSIDVVLPRSGSWQQDTDQLLTELRTATSEQVIAYRGNHRWQQAFEPVRVDASLEQTPRLTERGVYLITGGLGGIGLVLAEHLAKTVQAKLILIGRSPFPAREEWQHWLTTHEETDDISRKIGKVRELEALGAEVLVVSADVANLAQMQAVVAQAQERFGRLNGVIHAAGIVGGTSFSTIAQIDRIECEQQFQSKLYGLLVLEKVLQGKQLDFCLLLSSLSSVLGGLGYVAYAAANLFMDRFVYDRNQNSLLRWLSVNWDSWRVDQGKKDKYFGSIAEFLIEPDEGVKAFQRILACRNFNQVVVSTGDLHTRIKQWIQPEDLDDGTTAKKSSLHPRPDLQSAYGAPRNGTERKLADIWQTLLGIEQVGIHDNFFELGGDSLLAIQVISRVHKTLHIELSINSIFEDPTVAGLSQQIERMRLTTQMQMTTAVGKREEGVL